MRKAAAILLSKSTNDFRHVSACASDAACFFSRRLIHSASCAQLRPGPMHNSRCNANAKSTPKSYFMKTLRKNRGEGVNPHLAQVARARSAYGVTLHNVLTIVDGQHRSSSQSHSAFAAVMLRQPEIPSLRVRVMDVCLTDPEGCRRYPGNPPPWSFSSRLCWSPFRSSATGCPIRSTVAKLYSKLHSVDTATPSLVPPTSPPSLPRAPPASAPAADPRQTHPATVPTPHPPPSAGRKNLPPWPGTRSASPPSSPCPANRDAASPPPAHSLRPPAPLRAPGRRQAPCRSAL